MFDVTPPHSSAEIADRLERQREEIGRYFGELSEAVLAAPQGEHWSPAEHLRHLTRSVRALAGGLEKPKWLLIAFGLARTSRSYEETVELYRRALADGGVAAGRYAPTDAEPSREVVLTRWQLAGEQLVRAMARWRESQLDRYRLPHPLLGKLTAREMLFFTLYHNAHHARRVVERAGDGR